MKTNPRGKEHASGPQSFVRVPKSFILYRGTVGHSMVETGQKDNRQIFRMLISIETSLKTDNMIEKIGYQISAWIVKPAIEIMDSSTPVVV